MQPTQHRARFLDGWSLAETSVTVEVHGDRVRVVNDQGTALGDWHARELHVDAMQEGVVHVTRGPDAPETLVVTDPELARRLLAMAQQVQRLPGGERRRRFVLSMIAGIVVLGAGFYYAAPWLAHVVAVNVPLEHERALGGQIETLLDLSRCSDAAAEASLDVLVGALTQQDRVRTEVRLVESKLPNAFALPGGIIVVTTALLKEAKGEAEVAGVLAHEIEHVVQRHVLAGFVRDTVLSALWALTMGDYAGLMVVDPTTAYRVANLEFSRTDEEAADTGALTRLHRAGLGHAGLIDFFERIQQEHGGGEGPEWLSTHPNTAARVSRLRATRDIARPAQLLSTTQFDALRQACAPTPAADTKPP